MEHLNDLQTMFPSLDGSLIVRVLTQNKENVEMAVERLLELSSQAENVSKSPPPPNLKPQKSQSSHGWMTPSPHIFSAIPVMYNHVPLSHPHQLLQQQPYMSSQPHVKGRPGYSPEPGMYDNMWPGLHHNGGMQYQPVSVNHPLPNRKGSLMERALPNSALGVSSGESVMPTRSHTAPGNLVGGVHHWRPPHPGLRASNGGHVIGTSYPEHAQRISPSSMLHGQPRNIPRLQNRHVDVRGHYEQPLRSQGLKVQERSTVPEPEPKPLEKRLIIIRGLPGSGKSTLARNLRGQSGVICSTDDFFMVDGKYVFDPNLLGENHEKNRVKARQSMGRGKSPVIIDNTNANAWEMKPYVAMALEYGYDVEIVEPDTPWRFKVAELARRNKHGVSRQTIERMLEKYEHRMSVERILTSERPDRDAPTNRPPPNEQIKEKERVSKNHQKGVEKPKSPSIEKWQRDNKPTNGRATANKTQDSRAKKSSLSPKPTKKTEAITQRRTVKQGDSANKNGSHSNHHVLKANAKPINSKEDNKNKKAKQTQTKNADLRTKADSVSSVAIATNQSGMISLANVLSVAEIEAGLLAEAQWDSSEELELLSDEELSEAGTSGKEQGSNHKSTVDSNQNAHDVAQQNISTETMTVNEQDMNGAGALAMLDQTWEIVSRETSKSEISKLTAMFAQLQVPPSSLSPISNPTNHVNKLPSAMSAPDMNVASELGTRDTNLASELGTHDTNLASESGTHNTYIASELGTHKMNVASELDRHNTSAPSLPKPPGIDIGNQNKPTSYINSTGAVSTIPSGSVSNRTIGADSNKLGDGKKPKSLSTLITAFDSCKDWEEKYLAEAAKDEAKNPLHSFGEDTSNLVESIMEGLIPNDAHPMTLTFTDSESPTTRVERKSRLVSGLTLKQLPREKHIELTDPILSALQATLIQLDWVQSIVPPVNSDTVPKEGSQGQSEIHTVDQGPNEHGSSIGSISGSNLLPIQETGEINLDEKTNTLFSTIEQGFNKLDEFPDFLKDTEDPSGDKTVEERKKFSDEDLQGSANESLDAFLSSENATSSKEVSSSMHADSLEQELSTTARNAEVFPSAFPVTTENTALSAAVVNKDKEPNSFSPPSSSPSPVPVYVSLGESLYSSDEDNHQGILFSVQNLREKEGEIEDALNFDENEATGMKSEEHCSKSETDLISAEYTLESTKNFGNSFDLESDDMDLMFLIGCFPDLEPSYLDQLLAKCGDVETALSVALVSMTTPVPLETQSEDAFNEVECATDVTSVDERSLNYEAECVNDEKIAQMLQEEMNRSVYKANADLTGYNDSSTVVSSNKSSPSKAESSDDDNLVLTLTESFSKQLQALFGPIARHLPHKGEIREEDLQVLLSESVAKGIYQMWIKTLQAKHVEYQVQAELSLRQDPLTRSLMEADGGKQRVTSEPLLQNHIPQTHPLQHHTPRTHHHPSPPVATLTMAQEIQLNELYGSFPEVNRSTICDVLIGTNFNFKEAAEKLKSLFPSKASPGANPPIHHSHTVPTKMSSTKNKKQEGRSLFKQGGASPNKAIDVASNDENSDSYDNLRAEAALHAKLRAESFQKAAKAHGQKQFQLAQYYAQQGHLYTEKMKEANRRAAECTIQSKNYCSKKLDLHGLHVSEALEALQKRLSTEKGGKLEVVTGRGSHSEGQVARIKPAVISFLKRTNYKFEELNAGLLKVNLK